MIYLIDEKDKSIKLIKEYINNYIEYFNYVVSMEIFAESQLSSSNPGVCYIYKSMDETRRSYHDICVNTCGYLNEICKNYGLEPICDFNLNDRHEVAKFCGYIVSGIYAKGIKEEKSFDKMVKLFAENKMSIDRLTENDSEEDIII